MEEADDLEELDVFEEKEEMREPSTTLSTPSTFWKSFKQGLGLGLGLISAVILLLIFIGAIAGIITYVAPELWDLTGITYIP